MTARTQAVLCATWSVRPNQSKRVPAPAGRASPRGRRTARAVVDDRLRRRPADGVGDDADPHGVAAEGRDRGEVAVEQVRPPVRPQGRPRVRRGLVVDEVHPGGRAAPSCPAAGRAWPPPGDGPSPPSRHRLRRRPSPPPRPPRGRSPRAPARVATAGPSTPGVPPPTATTPPAALGRRRRAQDHVVVPPGAGREHRRREDGDEQRGGPAQPRPDAGRDPGGRVGHAAQPVTDLTNEQ